MKYFQVEMPTARSVATRLSGGVNGFADWPFAGKVSQPTNSSLPANTPAGFVWAVDLMWSLSIRYDFVESSGLTELLVGKLPASKQTTGGVCS